MDTLRTLVVYWCPHQMKKHEERRTMTRIPEWVTLGTALGCGLNAGVFFAFSSFVMPAIDRLPKSQAITAMQSINKLAVTPVFMTALFGTALACVGLSAWALVGDGPTGWLVAGCALFLAGAIVVTIVANVPLNNAVDAMTPDGPGSSAAWASYFSRWTAWNHVRAATSLAACGLLTVGLRLWLGVHAATARAGSRGLGGWH